MNLEQIKKTVVNEYLALGLDNEDVKFNPTSDCVNLVCEIVVTDRAGTKVAGHIYKTFEKDGGKKTFVARYYDD